MDMKLKTITIKNYKSFGNEKNQVKIENNVTSIIGKNESGKSNLIDSLRPINLKEGMTENFFKSKNRRALDDNVSLELTFSMNDNEAVDDETTFILSSPKTVQFSGKLSESILLKKKFSANIDLVIQNKDCFNTRNDEPTRQIKNRYFHALDRITSDVFIQKNFTDNMKKWLDVDDDTEREKINDAIDNIDNTLMEIYDTLPVFYFYEEKQLKDEYDCNAEFFKEFSSSSDFFSIFLKAAKINEQLLRNACLEADPGIQQDAKKEIQTLVENNIQNQFNKYYPQEKINIQININDSKFAILVETGKVSQKLSERSNGLKWYLNFFIDLIEKQLLGKYVVFLLDEPGVHLHVEAQKKLLELFYSLTQKGNQLLYTTHSPYMLDTNNIQAIRTVQKLSGIDISFISNNVYALEANGKAAKTSRYETLTPFLSAIGLKVSDNITFNNDRINVVTEGITDYLYLHAMQQHLKNESFYFIPSTGASNVDKLVSILIGWGFVTKAILDYDSSGKSAAEILEKKFYFSVNKDFFYVNLNEKYDGKSKITIEGLISDNDNKKLDFPYSAKDKDTKALSAKNYYELVCTGKLKPDKETCSNFKKLFNHILKTEK